MGVPAVVAMGNVRELVRDGDMLIIDGAAGAVVVNPSDRILQEYRRRQAVYADERAELGLLRDEPSITLDGIDVVLHANIELPEEAALALASGADGIGLFRSEFLFMGRPDLPGEEEQYEAYSSVVKVMAGRPVTIRTLDIGSDKTLDGEATVATNPALGQRAIRYCLARPEMFATQLRAILRASAHGPVRLLIPMIAHMHEVVATKAAIESARRELDARGQAYAPHMEVGAMVEVPAIAIAIEPFVQALDFLSIGTNDLIQYTLAIDRGDHDVATLYDPLHPAVLRLGGQYHQCGRACRQAGGGLRRNGGRFTHDPAIAGSGPDRVFDAPAAAAGRQARGAPCAFQRLADQSGYRAEPRLARGSGRNGSRLNHASATPSQ